MKELYEERKRLVKEGVKLRSLAMTKGLKKEKTFEIREHQTKQYKKFLFLDGFIKAREKLGDDKNDR